MNIMQTAEPNGEGIVKWGVYLLGKVPQEADIHGSQAMKGSYVVQSRGLYSEESLVWCLAGYLGDGLQYLMDFCRLVRLSNKDMKKGLFEWKKLPSQGDEESLGNFGVT